VPGPPPITPRLVRAELLAPASFAPFGTVVAVDHDGGGRTVNQGRALRLPGINDLAHDTGARKPVLDIYRIDPSPLPFAVTCFERHVLSSQVFVPMTCSRFLVAVAPDRGGKPDLSRAVAFVGNAKQIVHYRKGVWHAPMVALDTPAVMTMLMWEAGDERDCEEFSEFGNLDLQIVV